MPAKQKASEQGSQAQKKRLESTKAKGEVVTFLTRCAAGQYKKRSSEEEKQEASDTLCQYHSLAQEEKASFAQAYQGNKDQKTFQWARNFLQKVTVAKQDEEESVQKYMTRSSCLVLQFLS